jgi:uncharacterized protein (DUF4415 family)
MSKKKTMTRYTSDEIKNMPTPVIDWERVNALTDADIEQAIAEDPDAAPMLGKEFWERAKLVMPENSPKPQITIKVNSRTLSWFKKQGKGYQSRINAVLDAYVSEMERHA